MTAPRIRVHGIDASLGEAIAVLCKAEKKGYSLPLPFDQVESDGLNCLEAHRDLVSVVNLQLESPIKENERNRLLDILFSPSVARWDPFAHSLDFTRSCTQNLVDEISGLISRKDVSDCAVVVHGGAASGKTTILKRMAFDLARSGQVVLWAKPWFYPDPGRAIRALFNDLDKVIDKHNRNVVVVIDEYSTLRTLDPRLLLNIAQSSKISLTLVVGIRTSDWRATPTADLLGPLPVELEEEVPDSLDDNEWGAFPEYLVKLGIHPTVADAEKECRHLEKRDARDSLSMLYWLLPATRATISSAIRDEYFRLGDTASLKRILLGVAEHTSALLKRAYEYVAVSNHYGVPLPIEVLVSALGVDYSEWLAASSGDGPAWGILYADEDDDGAACYRTRNTLVNDTIIDTINGGITGHSGEYRNLSSLIRGCKDKGSPVYREFCVSVLVPHRSIDCFDYEEGLQLYNDAIEALPFEDKTLVHHKGLWAKNKGPSPKDAAAILEEALQTNVYPYSERGEADEHIHTSLAATALEALKKGQTSLANARAQAVEHLAKARSKNFFNPKAVHVQAGLVIQLTQALDGEEGADHFALINGGLADIDRALLLLRSRVRQSRTAVQDLHLLEARRDELLLSVANIENLDDEAERLWTQYQSQEGFVLIARKKYEKAREANKGKVFNEAHEYCQSIREKVTSASTPVSPALSEVQLLIVYHWRVLRGMFSKLEAKIEWDLIKDLVTATLTQEVASENPLYNYIYALACAHLGEWPEANGYFERQRKARLPADVLWEPRGFLLDKKGSPRSVQGVVKRGGRRDFLYSQELGVDFHLSNEPDWPREGEVAIARIRFSFGGPTAVQKTESF